VLEIIITGCAPWIPPEIMSAEDSVAAGKELKSTSSMDIAIDNPDLAARKKIVLIVNSIITEEYSTAETTDALRAIQNDPEVSRDLKIEAGYIISMVETISSRNKDIDRLQNKNTKCLNEKSELEKSLKEADSLLKEKEELITILVGEKQDLKFKLQKLEEIYQKSEKRRGLRK
jgi:tRNA threonylcarbamoyladenosine modification (KEOPS) complex Cgi121 subunit